MSTSVYFFSIRVDIANALINPDLVICDEGR